MVSALAETYTSNFPGEKYSTSQIRLENVSHMPVSVTPRPFSALAV